MINNPWHYDKTDKVQLSASLLLVGTTPDDDGDTILSAGDYGVVEDLAELATQLLPGLCYEGANWDGVVWLERLEATDDDSLAAQLLSLLVDHGEAPPAMALEVERLITSWLLLGDIPRRSHALDEEDL
jgi:hypothetical protein